MVEKIIAYHLYEAINHIHEIIQHGTKVHNYKQEDGNTKLCLNEEKQQMKKLWRKIMESRRTIPQVCPDK